MPIVTAPHESIDAIEAERYLALNAADPESSPEAVFERQWALTESRTVRSRASHALFAQLSRWCERLLAE
jgi:hypothetical protein